jgi:hypothetical protein
MEGESGSRIDARQLALLEYGVNAGSALRRGGVNYHSFVHVLAADQQQRVNRSVDAKLAAVSKGNGVKDEV